MIRGIQFGAPFDPHDQLGDMPILGTIVRRGVARSRLGAEVQNFRQKLSLWLGAPMVLPKKFLDPPPLKRLSKKIQRAHKNPTCNNVEVMTFYWIPMHVFLMPAILWMSRWGNLSNWPIFWCALRHITSHLCHLQKETSIKIISFSRISIYCKTNVLISAY